MAKNIFQNVIDSPAPVGTYYQPSAIQKEGALKTFGKAMIQEIVGLGEDIVAVSPSVKEIRTTLEQRGDVDLLGQLPEVPTFKKWTGDIIGTALYLPMGGIGIGAKVLKSMGFLRGLLSAGATGGAYGAGFGFSNALSQNKKMADIVDQTVKGAIIGVPLGLGGSLAIKGATFVGGKALAAGLEKLGQYFPKFLSSQGKVLEKNFGQIGKEAKTLFETQSQQARTSVGDVAARLWRVGLTEIQLPKWFKGLISFKEPEMLTRNEAWRSPTQSLKSRLQGRVGVKEPEYLYEFATQAIPEEKINTQKVDAAFEVADKLRRENLALAQNQKLLSGEVSADNYFQKIVPRLQAVELSSAEKLALTSAKTAEERANILYGKENSLRRDVLENAVILDQSFPDIESAAKVMDDWIDFVKSGGRMNPDNKWLQYLIKKGQAKTLEEAKDITMWEQRWRQRSLTPQASALDYPRKVDFPFYDPDPRRTLLLGASDNLNRIHYAEVFGKENEVLKQFGRELTELQGEDARQAFYKSVRRITGQIERRPKAEQASNLIRAIQTPKLSFAQIVNIGQSLNTLLATDIGALGYGLKMAFTTEGIVKALESGATLQSVMRQAMAYSGGSGKFSENWLRWSGFTWTEMFNRTVAANAGMKYLEKQATRLLKNPADQLVRWRISEVGVNPDEIIKSGGVNQAMKNSAGDIIAAKTQFLSRPIDLPAFAASPEGKVFFQFKNFAYQQTIFLKNKIMGDLAQGNTAGVFRTLLILGTVFPMTGEVLADVRSLITQSKRPMPLLSFDRYLENIANAGAWGITYDLITSVKYSKTLDAVFGPTPSSGADVLETMYQTLMRLSDGKEPTPGFYKTMLAQTGVGRIAGNAFFTPKKKDKKSILEMFDGF